MLWSDNIGPCEWVCMPRGAGVIAVVRGKLAIRDQVVHRGREFLVCQSFPSAVRARNSIAFSAESADLGNDVPNPSDYIPLAAMVK